LGKRIVVDIEVNEPPSIHQRMVHTSSLWHETDNLRQVTFKLFDICAWHARFQRCLACFQGPLIGLMCTVTISPVLIFLYLVVDYGEMSIPQVI
jgi:hypothetical protein